MGNVWGNVKPEATAPTSLLSISTPETATRSWVKAEFFVGTKDKETKENDSYILFPTNDSLWARFLIWLYDNHFAALTMQSIGDDHVSVPVFGDIMITNDQQTVWILSSKQSIDWNEEKNGPAWCHPLVKAFVEAIADPDLEICPIDRWSVAPWLFKNYNVAFQGSKLFFLQTDRVAPEN